MFGVASLLQSITLDVVTALRVAYLGATPYPVLRRQDERIAPTAFAFYLIDAAMPSPAPYRR